MARKKPAEDKATNKLLNSVQAGHCSHCDKPCRYERCPDCGRLAWLPPEMFTTGWRAVPYGKLMQYGLWPRKDEAPKAEETLEQREDRVLTTLCETIPTHVDEIVSKTGLPMATVLATLLILEVRKLVRQYPGKRYGLMPRRKPVNPEPETTNPEPTPASALAAEFAKLKAALAS